MIPRVSETLLLRPEDLRPLHDDFVVVGAFNPGAVRVDDEIVLLVRVAERPRERRAGFVGLPRRQADGRLVIDWTPERELDLSDPRVVRQRSDGLARLTSISHLRVFRGPSQRPQDLRPGPFFLPTSPLEEFGVEDPRIVELQGTYWITYVAVSRHGAATALASSRDMSTFERHGLMFCPENKDVVLFPQQVDGHYVALHRPSGGARFTKPEIWLARSSNLLQWGQHEVVLGGVAEWESDRVGAGAPPVLLPEGWLTIYHGSQASRQDRKPGGMGPYAAGAMLLDRDCPTRVLRRSAEPIMEPTAPFERSGFVDDVVFPTALIPQGDLLRVFYGAADTCTAMVELSLVELLAALH